MCNICQNPEGKFTMTGIPGKMCTACHDAILQARKGNIETAKNYFDSIVFASEIGHRYVQNELELDTYTVMSKDELNVKQKEMQDAIHSVILSTADAISNHQIESYGNIVTGITVLGTGFFSELNANISDFLGVTSTSMENKISEAKDNALYMLKKEAYQNNCNAVIGISLSFVPFANNMIGLVATGTAVKVTEC